MIQLIAEIGINHNGSIQECKKLIMLAKIAGAQFAKIQKRNPDICVPEHQKKIMKDTPWGKMTYLEYKHKIEFDEEQIKELFEYSQQIGIEFFASVWDIDSMKLMSKYTQYVKLGSAVINNHELLRETRKHFNFVIMSTGMSTEEEVINAINIGQPNVIMHTNSTYPCPVEDLNLRYIEYLKGKYGNVAEIGYSGHEIELIPTYTAIGLGATWIERHITLNQNLWGSDQKSSLEPDDFIKLVRNIRMIEQTIQYKPAPRILFESENIKKKSLRK